MLSLDKRENLKRAEHLILKGDPASLRYACLELRLCMEVVAYEKLRVYDARLPPSLFSVWQPPQLFRALEQIEPGSTHSHVVRFAEEVSSDGPPRAWRLLGEHETFRGKELRKMYNKVGSFLHASMPKKGRQPQAISLTVDKAREIVEALRPVVESRFDGGLAEVFHFPCTVCGEQVVVNSRGAAASGRAECLNPSCGAQFHIQSKEGRAERYILDATAFECLSCEDLIQVENRNLEIGFEFDCAECGENHRLVTRQWGDALVRELDSADPSTGNDSPPAPEGLGEESQSGNSM